LRIALSVIIRKSPWKNWEKETHWNKHAVKPVKMEYAAGKGKRRHWGE
jgi:hypothetical protein